MLAIVGIYIQKTAGKMIMNCSDNKNVSKSSLPAPSVNSLSHVAKPKEHYYCNPHEFCHQYGHEIETIHVPEILIGLHDIMQKGTIFCPSLKIPSKQRPEEGHRSFPHAVQHQVNKASPAQYEHQCASLSGINVVPRYDQYQNEQQGVCKYPAAGKHIFKQHPANDLINDIREHGSYCHVPVVDVRPDLRERQGCNDEYCKSYSNMCKWEHCDDNLINMLKRI